MAPKTKEAILALNARELIEEIEKMGDVALLDDIELAELQREDEDKGSGRKTVFAALKERRAELSKPDEKDRRSDKQDVAVAKAFVDGKLPGEDRRQIRVRAKSKGFYGGNRIRAGALFTIESEKQLAPWMELAGDEPEVEAVSAPVADDSASGSNGSDVI